MNRFMNLRPLGQLISRFGCMSYVTRMTFGYYYQYSTNFSNLANIHNFSASMKDLTIPSSPLYTTVEPCE